jgi:hypothetical protein
VCALLGVHLTPAPAHARGRNPARDPVAAAVAALASDRSEKVRIQAALVLGRTHDPRATPTLIRALGDGSPMVRAMAAKALGQIRSEEARGALEVAAGDVHPLVRRHAALALEALGTGETHSVEVMPVADRTRTAPAALRERMRELIAAQLAHISPRTRRRPTGYAVDSTIKALATTDRADMVEVACTVELVVSTGRDHAILLMSSGEAVVQRQRRVYRPGMHPEMQMQAVEHAVRSATGQLRQHFAANGP